METESRWSRGDRIKGLAAAVLVTGLMIGWAIDHSRQQSRLAPFVEEKSDWQSLLETRQRLLYEAEKSRGFHSWAQVEATIVYVPRYGSRQYAQFIVLADDDVYMEAVPKLIAMLDDPDPTRRVRAWMTLREAEKSPRFAQFRESYREGAVGLLRDPSSENMEEILAWFRRKKIDSPAALAQLRQRMMEDGPNAPQFAYTLAELDPTADIVPRLVEMIENKHSDWLMILYQLPKYLPEEEAKRLFEQYRPDPSP